MMSLKFGFKMIGTAAAAAATFAALSALSQIAIAATAQEMLPVMPSTMPSEMASRPQKFDALQASLQPVQLRSANAPTHRVALQPTKQLMLEAAANAKGSNGSNKSGKEVSIAELVGVNIEPPVAPYYVGPVFESGMQATNLNWQAVPGGHVTHIVVSSDGAVGIRAKLVLPIGLVIGEIRVAATPTSNAEVLPLSLAQDGVLWTPYTEGGSQTIEIFTSQKISDAPIKVERVSHFIESILTGKTAKGPIEASVPLAGSCTVDVVCTTNNATLDAAIAERSNSVARVNFVSKGGNFLCSGTLINSGQFPAPFFLLANHCISTTAEAASVATVWFRKNMTCGANVANENNVFFPGQVTLFGGAQLVFTNQMTDATLLRLNQSPPNGVVYAGWNAALMTKGDSVVSISHPAGAPMKWALGTVNVIDAAGQPSATNTTGLLGLQGYNQQMYGIYFTQGIIEGGSSGSGIFTLSNGGLQLRGILSSSTLRNSTSLSCTNLNENSNYGRFEIFYEQIKYFLNGVSLPADDFPNQPAVSGPSLPLNSTLSANLSYIGDLDVFRIAVTEPGTLSVGSRGLAADGTPLDTIAILLQSDGSCMPDPTGKSECNNNATNDDAPDTVPPASPRNTNFLIKDIIVQPGTYYVSVGMWDPQAITPNGYQIYSTFVPANQPVLTAQTITFADPGTRPFSDGVVAVAATASSALPVSLVSLTNAVCGVSGSNITFTSAGVCTITADQAGNTTFAAAPQIKRSFIVYVAKALSKRAAIDIDGSGKSTLVVRSAAAQMLGGRLANGQFSFTPLTDPGAAYRLVAAVDFDGNGKSDLAFQNPTALDALGTSSVYVWNDFLPATQRILRNVKPVWDVQVTGDLDNDGLGDLVWRYVVTNSPDTGVSYIWFASGINGADIPVVRKRGGAPLDWKLLGAADLNGDGAADMIYISPSGTIRALMATAARTCANLLVGTMPAGFTALKLADFTGQRRGDMLIRNQATGIANLISLNAVGFALPPYTGDPNDRNASCTSSTLTVNNTLIALPATDPTWQFYASGDFDGDGIMDMVWLRPNGTLTVWLMGNNGVVNTVIDNAGAAPIGFTVFQP